MSQEMNSRVSGKSTSTNHESFRDTINRQQKHVTSHMSTFLKSSSKSWLLQESTQFRQEVQDQQRRAALGKAEPCTSAPRTLTTPSTSPSAGSYPTRYHKRSIEVFLACRLKIVAYRASSTSLGIQLTRCLPTYASVPFAPQPKMILPQGGINFPIHRAEESAICDNISTGV
jgi:hypothetical protein